MKKLNQFILGIIGVIALFLFISTPLKAQHHMSGQDQSQHMGEHQDAAMHSTNQHMMNMNQHMMNMNDMMIHMNEMVVKSDQMLHSMHGEQGSGMMAGSGNNMMMMQHNVNDMAKDMQKFMEQMNKMMSDENLMNDSEMKKHMDEMHQNMNTMMSGMGGMFLQTFLSLPGMTYCLKRAIMI